MIGSACEKCYATRGHYTAPTVKACMSDVRGYDDAIAQIVDAIVHRRNVLIRSHPGIGPLMLARRIPDILPVPTDHDRRWWEAEYEGAGMPHARVGFPSGAKRPFRAPHHSVSARALIGSARHAGELALARGGVLYLDEFAEFTRGALGDLACRLQCAPRPPIVVASVNRCPCGWQGSSRLCHCSLGSLEMFNQRVARMAEPYRFVTIELDKQPSLDEIRGLDPTETSESIRNRITERIGPEWMGPKW